MKTKTFFRLGLMVTFVLSAQLSFAQIIELPTVVIRATSTVNTKVTDAFKGKFKNAVDPRWYKLDKNYLVKFMMDQQKNNALYDKKGEIIYHLTYGDESNLPKTAHDLVANKYPGCKITTAIHVDQDQRSIWIVNVEYGKELVLARIEEGELEEIQRMQNGSV